MNSCEDARPCAGYLLDALHAVGIEYVFCNMGTDHVPIIEALAARRQRGEPVPKLVPCPHENTAIHMAGGYAVVTGRGQAVLVHVDVGTANAATGLHNLLRTRVPVLLMAGKAPYTTGGELLGTRDTYVHFIQEPFDQGSLVRPYVKWEWTLPSGVVAREAIQRAHEVMQSEPRGPAYLMFSRETLAEALPPSKVRAIDGRRMSAVAVTNAPDPKAIDEVARRLRTAAHPILVTSYGGRNPRTSKAIEALAAAAGIRVFEANSVNNIAHEGPHFCGYHPAPHLAKADVALLVDVDVPWIPADVALSPDTFWVHVDVDVLKVNSPMWTFPADLRMQGGSDLVLEQLRERLEALRGSADDSGVSERSRRILHERQAWRDDVARAAEDPGRPGDINPHHLFAQLGKHLQPTDIVVNEGVRNAAAVLAQLPRPMPATLVRFGGGGLGYSGGMALGAKLAAPQHLVVQIVGDGSFYFGNMDSVLAVSGQHGLPIFAIVLDNGGWAAVKESTLRVYPDGEARQHNAFAAALAHDVDFSLMARAYGAHGEILDEPDRVAEALARCIGIVKAGRSAVLQVRLASV